MRPGTTTGNLAAPERNPPAAEHRALLRAADLMTPAVFSVAPETSALKVAEEMVRLNVHRLFVVNDDGLLIGVISALDLLRYLSSGELSSIKKG
jgi:CBS domain-containing protein